MADLEKAWNRVLDKGSKKAIANLRNIHANNPRFQEVLKNRGEQGGSPSAAAAKKVKVEPRKIIAVKPDSIRALNAARQQAYLAKGGRQPIGAMGSGGSNVMAGAGQSTIKDLKASIKAGFNPRVSLDPYESERAKKIGPRSLKMKKEEVQVDEAMSPEAAKKKRIFDLKLKMIKKVANYKSRTKSSKVDEPHSSLNPASDMKLSPKAPSGGGKNYYKEETQIDEVTGYEGVKDRKDIIKRAAAMNRMGKDVFLARVKTRAAEMKKEKASKELAKEEVQIDEVTKKEAEVALGGPVKDKPKGPAGKLPLGFRMARSAARKAMRGAVSAVHKSMEKTMQKEDVNEAIKDAADVGEYDYEGDMAKSQLRSIMANSKRMHDMLEENTNLPEWVQSKITLAEDYISTASNYMQGEMNEEVEQVDEKINLVKAKMGTVIKDFKKSDAPQFKGKSMEKRRQMAIAAKLGAEREAGMREEVEQVDEKVEIFHKQGSGGDMERYKKDTSNPAAVLARKKAADAAKKSRAAGDLKSKNMGQTASTGNGGAVKAVSTTSQGFKKGSSITEAEGTVAVTPKEKALAAHHGDPKRITYGDVIKARLKSVATKKMDK